MAWSLRSLHVGVGATPHRTVIPRECAKLAGRNPDDWSAVVAFVNTDIDWGNSGKYVILSGPNGQSYDVWASVHELGHAFGLNHTPNSNNSDSQNPYGNPWDPMSARTQAIFTYTNPLNRPEGPELTSGNRDVLGALPARRVAFVPQGAAAQTVRLSALNRPATPHFLQIQIKEAEAADPLTYYSLEYREPSGFDRAISRPTVLIHRVRPTLRTVRLIADQDGVFTRWSSSERLAGETYTFPGIATVRVASIDPVKHVADIEITPN